MTPLDRLFGLRGKTAVVIGGGGVLAGEMASALAMAGARVAVVGPHPENCEKKASEIRKRKGKAIALRADAARKEDLASALKTVVKKFGGVDVLINAPGINSATPFFEIRESEWQKILDVNLKSVFNACQVFGKHMTARGRGGSIINISSVSSEIPLSRVFTYSISKAGVNNLTRFLAREFAPRRVRVNAIIPGFFPAKQNRKILTPDRVREIMRHTPMKRFGGKQELVGAVLWLASARASGFVTGALIPVDGGFTAMSI